MRGVLTFLAAMSIASPTPAQEWISPKDQIIPEAYHGKWALSSEFCASGEGPAIVEIGPRTIFFYESYGFLELAQLNHTDDPPELYGEFAFAGGLEFWHKVYRLQLIGRNLFITEIKAKDDPPSKMPWFRCP